MKRFPMHAAIALLGLAPTGADARAPVPAPATTRKAAVAFPAVRAFVDPVVRDGKVPGIAIAVGVGDEPPTWIVAGKTAFGGSMPASPDTLWRIYSMTKPITGIAAMILIDEGKLRLDQPVSDFFPEFATAKVLVDPAKAMITRPAKRTITIRDLMTHTSGLNYAILPNTPAQQQLQAQGVTPFQFNRVLESRMRPLRAPNLAEFAGRAGRSPLVADPGTAWNYSMGLDVLAAVIEKASRMPLADFVQRRLLTPLAMTSTGWRVDATQAKRLAASYGPRAALEKTWPGSTTPVNDTIALLDRPATSVYLNAPSFPYGGAGLVSTARDYDRFLRMLLNDGRLGSKRILSINTARLAKSNLMPAGVFMNGPGPVAPGEPAGFGAGGFVVLKDVDGFGRGKGAYGWDGAAGTRAWVDPVRHVRATMMINMLGSIGLGNDFDKALARDLAKLPVQP
ncbi:serine hydrolase [Novosphingobium sp. 9U]|uniref:serine hydrolase domain-containing protein n=1 Tax=Novosphingobium sp. 9U TaxID=2653158 RepID=UPI0012F3AD29|nr:serine hydrolase domain-containing protein [Novosphingobium sp. 9U]VWX46767.1 Beta-lactamase class C and other penicillin binding proteins [Novosphingobium sp. 9U]